MTRSGILNPDLLWAIASCGHKDYFVIADSGLPIPEGPQVIDLSLIRGIPSFIQVLEAVSKTLVAESYIVAKETEEKNPEALQKISKIMGSLPCEKVSHEELKLLTQKAKFVVRTGEATPYSNIILCCGVNF